MNKITVTIEFSEQELQGLLLAGLPGVEIADQERIRKIMQSRKFSKNLAYDIKEAYAQSWREQPEWEVLEGLGISPALEDTTQYS